MSNVFEPRSQTDSVLPSKSSENFGIKSLKLQKFGTLFLMTQKIEDIEVFKNSIKKWELCITQFH